MLIWGRGTGASLQRSWSDGSSQGAGPLTSRQRYKAPLPTGCTETPERVYGFNRNGCTKSAGISSLMDCRSRLSY